MQTTLIDRALPTLRCPACGDAGELLCRPQGLRCGRCLTDYPVTDGVLSFIPHGAFEPGLAQRFMESPAIAAIYEDVFRPAFTALGSSVSYADEEAWLSTHDATVPGLVMVDLACGSGRYARFLARRHPDAVVIAIDLSWPMLQIAQRKASAMGITNILWVRGDAQRLPLASHSVGRFNCFGALHLFPVPEQALAEAGRTCAPGATYTCLTTAIRTEPWPARAQAAFARLARFRFFAPVALTDTLVVNGFGAVMLQQKNMLLLLAAQRRPL